ncbi:MAG: DUF4625 domain-containing protein [Tannerellaceae bacterium]|nr:DUF4625 domain-containing protein [Tannerellaceae bacterium]
MKTATFFLTVIATLFATAFLTACDEDGDTTKPAIHLVSPAEGAVLIIGERIDFEAVFTDNENLGSYKIDIHDASGHTHGHDESDGDYGHDHGDSKEDAFSFVDTWNLSGISQTVKHTDILIPSSATPGAYHLVVYCYDASGNETYVARTISFVDKLE